MESRSLNDDYFKDILGIPNRGPNNQEITLPVVFFWSSRNRVILTPGVRSGLMWLQPLSLEPSCLEEEFHQGQNGSMLEKVQMDPGRWMIFDISLDFREAGNKGK